MRRRWQPRVRDRARKQAAASTGLVIRTRARFGFTAAPGTSDDARIRDDIALALPPHHAARLLDAQDAGAGEQQPRGLATDALGEVYFRDGGRLAAGLSRRQPSDGSPAPGSDPDTERDSNRKKTTWMHTATVIATVIGAIAAISRVVFTGWATCVSAKVALDQMEQSREDNENEERRQAARVTFWTESSSLDGGDLTVHLVNRTPDPVNRGHIQVRTPQKSVNGVYDVTGDAPAVPPCSELVFKMADQKAGIPDPTSGKPRGIGLKEALPPWKYEFVDNNDVV